MPGTARAGGFKADGPTRVFKNKHQAVNQGVRRFGKRSPPEADEHL
jgi:hypothetical protein